MNRTCSCGASLTVPDDDDDNRGAARLAIKTWSLEHAFSCEAMKGEVLIPWRVTKDMWGTSAVNMSPEMFLLKALDEGIALKKETD